jgi:hypothetical protein
MQWKIVRCECSIKGESPVNWGKHDRLARQWRNCGFHKWIRKVLSSCAPITFLKNASHVAFLRRSVNMLPGLIELTPQLKALLSDFDRSASERKSTNKDTSALSDSHYVVSFLTTLDRLNVISLRFVEGIPLKRLQWSRGRVLASNAQVRGFKRRRNRRIFQDEKIPSTPSFGGEVKPAVPCLRFTACKRSLNVTWKSAFRQNSRLIFIAH